MSERLWKVTLWFKSQPSTPFSFDSIPESFMEEIERQWQNKERCVFKGPDAGVLIDWADVYKVNMKFVYVA